MRKRGDRRRTQRAIRLRLQNFAATLRDPSLPTLNQIPPSPLNDQPHTADSAWAAKLRKAAELGRLGNLRACRRLWSDC